MVKRYLTGVFLFCLVLSAAEIYFFKAFTYLLQRDVSMRCMPVMGNSKRHLFTILQTRQDLSFNLLHKDVDVEFFDVNEAYRIDSLIRQGVGAFDLGGDLYFSNQKNIYILRRASLTSR